MYELGMAYEFFVDWACVPTDQPEVNYSIKESLYVLTHIIMWKEIAKFINTGLLICNMCRFQKLTFGILNEQ